MNLATILKSNVKGTNFLIPEGLYTVKSFSGLQEDPKHDGFFFINFILDDEANTKASIRTSENLVEKVNKTQLQLTVDAITSQLDISDEMSFEDLLMSTQGLVLVNKHYFSTSGVEQNGFSIPFKNQLEASSDADDLLA